MWWCLVMAVVLVGCGDADDETDGEGPEPTSMRSEPGFECTLDHYPGSFQVTAMRGGVPDAEVSGNTLGSLLAARQAGYRHVEVDFRLSADDVLISAHNPSTITCGSVRERPAADLLACENGGSHPATLDELLSMDFDSILIDLKDSEDGSDALLEAAALRAIDDIVAFEREHVAALMLYRATDAISERLTTTGVRTALKGYPASPADVREFIAHAQLEQFDFICVRAVHVTPTLVAEAADVGVWFLPWDYAEPANVAHWQSLARSGIGGLIVADPTLADPLVDQFQPLCE